MLTNCGNYNKSRVILRLLFNNEQSAFRPHKAYT